MNTDFGPNPYFASFPPCSLKSALSGCAHLNQVILFQQMFTECGPHAGNQAQWPAEPDVPNGENSSAHRTN